MRWNSKLFLLATATFAFCLGCVSDSRRSRPVAAPSPEEIPKIEFPQSTYPASIGILGATRRDPLTPFLPKFEAAEPTEEERKILEGEKKPRKYDFLALYTGPPAPNVTPLDAGGGAIGVAGQGGPAVGHIAPPVNSGVHGQEQPLVGEGPARVVTRASLNDRTKPSHVTDEHFVGVGEIPATRRTAVDRRREED